MTHAEQIAKLAQIEMAMNMMGNYINQEAAKQSYAAHVAEQNRQAEAQRVQAIVDANAKSAPAQTDAAQREAQYRALPMVGFGSSKITDSYVHSPNVNIRG